MTALIPQRFRQQSAVGRLLIVAVLLGLAGLPLAVWLDLRALSAKLLLSQADEFGRVVDDVRDFYATDVVDRVLNAPGPVTTVHNYRDIPGAIPIPATLSLELGRLSRANNGNVRYRFVSEYPFAGRAPHPLDAFERGALATLRADPRQPVREVTGSIFERNVRVATPIIMAQACVSCHNAHPASPKRDWKVGDVRGIQEIAVSQPIEANVFAFKYLLFYLVAAGIAGACFILLQKRQARLIENMNGELSQANDFLAAIATKIAKYIPPQIYKSVFSGQKDVVVATERKKLTMFFSDIKDFTATSERLQPEELTRLLNEYLTEMSAIAQRHGGTIDKFIGDAMLVFFGDPETRGVQQDARACLQMAVEMQARLHQLEHAWRERGIETPFRARMGINTGFCNVGNFGSDDRMHYTIIGAEANLAARLQYIAEPGGIVISYETFAHVREMVRARPLDPISMKGINRQVVPYSVEGLVDDLATSKVISEHETGLDLFIDPGVMDQRTVERARRKLRDALAELDKAMPGSCLPHPAGG